MRDKQRLWPTLIKKATEELKEAADALLNARDSLRKLAEEEERLRRLKEEYLGKLSAPFSSLASDSRQVITRSFLTQLELAITGMEDQKRSLMIHRDKSKLLYERRYKALKKYEALDVREEVRRKKVQSRRESREQDLLNISRYNAK